MTDRAEERARALVSRGDEEEIARNVAAALRDARRDRDDEWREALAHAMHGMGSLDILNTDRSTRLKNLYALAAAAPARDLTENKSDAPPPAAQDSQPASEQDSQNTSADAQVRGARSAGSLESLRGTSPGHSPPKAAQERETGSPGPKEDALNRLLAERASAHAPDLSGIPRRCRLDKLTPAEHAIRNAVMEVEKVGAHLHLTDAVILLGRARDAVADFMDGVPHSAPPQPGERKKCALCVSGEPHYHQASPYRHGQPAPQPGEAQAPGPAPSAVCVSCGTGMHAEEIHCENCWEDLIEDETSQDGTSPAPPDGALRDLLRECIPFVETIAAQINSVEARALLARLTKAQSGK